MNFIGNAFSINMIESAKQGIPTDFRVTKLDPDRAAELIETQKTVDAFKSVVGHRDIALLIECDLDLEVRFNRETIKLRDGDQMIVAQYCGPRLREGATELPPGAQIDYFLVEMGV